MFYNIASDGHRATITIGLFRVGEDAEKAAQDQEATYTCTHFN